MRRLSGLCCFLSLALFLQPLVMASHPELAQDIPLPSARGDRGIHVWQTQLALHALDYLSAEPEGYFDEQTMLALYAFQQEKGLSPSGEADAQTLYLLFTPPAPQKGDTLRPYWYGEGSQTIPIGANFQVRDVRTGITFQAVRIMGVSHLDAEPLTAADTALMLSAYGGQWAWDRRPILINYLDTIYAASMNGKPHGWEVIPGNGMSGHFCIHYFGARGDGSQRVDPEHLAAAIEAGLARWEDRK